MIFIKLIEVILFIILLPFSAISNLLPTVPEGVTNVLTTVVSYIHQGLSFALFFLTCGGNNLLQAMYSLLVGLIIIKLTLQIFINLVGKFIKKD